MIRQRRLGRTGLNVPEISFGCGGTAGLMVRGSFEEQCAVVSYALERGIDLFDTSPTYGGGHSETNLGRVLTALGATPRVSTKVDFAPADADDFAASIERSVQRSLDRLQRQRLDILYVHSRVGRRRDLPGRVLTVADILGAGGIAETLESLQRRGLVGAIGFTGLGHTDAVLEVLRSGRFDLFQAYYNFINPSAMMPTPAAWRAQDYEEMIPLAATMDIGVVAIRALAAGALSDNGTMHALAKPYSSLSAAEVDADRVRAGAFRSILPRDYSMARFATRYALTPSVVSTVLIGVSERSHLEEAIAASNEGPLDAAQLAAIEARFRELYETA
jgi:L-glyceraldehyde 3-phosphate reductase